MKKIDKFLGKWASRKLMVFMFATGLAIAGIIDGTEWAALAVMYMFVQGVIDARDYFLKKKEEL